MIRVTNRSGTDLNAVCSGLNKVRPMDGPNNKSSQRTCSLKYDGYKSPRQCMPLIVDKAVTTLA
ncbi:hypothetical protein CU280_00220 [Yersinia mollaretii]|nr:hypothetical protein CU280_00220 [Yersinia mollaretii]